METRGTLCVAGLVYFEVFLPEAPPQVNLGEEVFVDDIGAGLGGALNSASVAHALGADTTIAYPSGSGATDAATRHEIERMGLASIRWEAPDDPAISLVRSEQGDRAFTSRAAFEALGDCPGLDDFDRVHVPGLREAAHLRDRLVAARAAGAHVSVSGSWAPAELDRLLDAPEPLWDLFIANRAEATRAAPDGVPSTLFDRAPFDVIITGRDVVRARIDGVDYERPIDPVDDPVDTTGAGDAFCGGFIAARMAGRAPDAALRRAAEVAARVVQVRGGVVEGF